MFGAGGSTRTVLPRARAVVGAVAALAALIQKAATPKLLLFIVQPEARSANPFGAFINRNHFAAWLLLVSTAESSGTDRAAAHPSTRTTAAGAAS